MLRIPPAIESSYKAILDKNGDALKSRPHYLKWLRYYLDFCGKYQFDRKSSDSLESFIQKLTQKKQTEQQRQQARQAVRFFHQMAQLPGSPKPGLRQLNKTSTKPLHGVKGTKNMVRGVMPAAPVAVRSPSGHPGVGHKNEPKKQPRLNGEKPVSNPGDRQASPRLESAEPRARQYLLPSAGSGISINENPELKHIGADWREIYHALETAIKVRHYSPRTLKAYRSWTRQFQTFTKSKDPRLISVHDVKAFLSFLAVKREVSASSQNQAFNALLFLFRHVLGKDFGKVEGVVRAKRKPYIPVVLSREEIDTIIGFLQYPHNLIAKLLYGCGLRLSECLGPHVSSQFCEPFTAGQL